MSGSSTSRSRRRDRLVLGQVASMGSRTAATATAWRAAWSAPPRRPSCGQLDLEPLEQMLASVWLRSAALRMYAAICVSSATGGRSRASAKTLPVRARVASRKLPDEQLLDLMADERPAGGEDQVCEACVRRLVRR